MPESSSGPELHPLVMSLAARIRQCREGLPESAGSCEFLRISRRSSAVLMGRRCSYATRCTAVAVFASCILKRPDWGWACKSSTACSFPDPRFDLPVFGADIVASPAGISAAIVDLSPVGEHLARCHQRSPQQHRHSPAFEQVRDLPAWATIFSPFVRFIRPANREEEDWFVGLVETYLGILSRAVERAQPTASSDPFTIARYHGQVSYCQQQKRNDKTRRVLEKAFGTDLGRPLHRKAAFRRTRLPVMSKSHSMDRGRVRSRSLSLLAVSRYLQRPGTVVSGGSSDRCAPRAPVAVAALGAASSSWRDSPSRGTDQRVRRHPPSVQASCE